MHNYLYFKYFFFVIVGLQSNIMQLLSSTVYNIYIFVSYCTEYLIMFYSTIMNVFGHLLNSHIVTSIREHENIIISILGNWLTPYLPPPYQLFYFR